MAKRGLLSFTMRREVYKEAMSRFGGRRIKTSETLISGRPANSVTEYIRRDRSTRASYRRISKNAGRRLVSRIQKKQRALDLIDTRLMISSWIVKLVDTSGNGLKADIRLRNKTPYVSYAHPKGTSRRHTFVRVYLPKIVREVSEELAVDQAEFVSTIATHIAADAARSAFQAVMRKR
tara:strand:+ start:324 stop:857 length:534 start_codon:yes stop_codon:yes gene_type:complete